MCSDYNYEELSELDNWCEPDSEEFIEICEWCGDPIETEPIRRRGLLFCCVDCADKYDYHNMTPEERDDFDFYHDFRDPGGKSALRVGPRIYPCPSCGRRNMLSRRDAELGYQCDICADEIEREW